MAIQMRRGNYNDFDPTRMMAGEFAVCLDNGYVYITLSPGNVVRLGTAETIEEAIQQVQEYVTQAQTSATVSTNKASDAEAYAVGKRNGTDVPSTDPAYENNAKYYAEQAKNAVQFEENTSGSSTKIGYQSIIVDGVSHIIPGTVYMQQTQQLTAKTPIDFIFTNSYITEDSEIDVWVSNYGLAPTNIETIDNQCTLTFTSEIDMELTCKIYIR